MDSIFEKNILTWDEPALIALPLTEDEHDFKLHLINPNVCEALPVMLSICVLYFRLSLNSIPRYA